MWFNQIVPKVSSHFQMNANSEVVDVLVGNFASAMGANSLDCSQWWNLKFNWMFS